MELGRAFVSVGSPSQAGGAAFLVTDARLWLTTKSSFLLLWGRGPTVADAFG